MVPAVPVIARARRDVMIVSHDFRSIVVVGDSQVDVDCNVFTTRTLRTPIRSRVPRTYAPRSALFASSYAIYMYVVNS